MKTKLVFLIILFLFLIIQVSLAGTIPTDLKNNDYNSSKVGTQNANNSNKNDSTGLNPTIAGALIGVSGVIFGSILTNWIQTIGWEKQKKLEQEKWQRDRLLEVYGKCIQHLSEPSIRNLESISWLYILLMYSQNKESFSELKGKIEHFQEATDNNYIEAKNEMVAYILQLAADDQRLKISD